MRERRRRRDEDLEECGGVCVPGDPLPLSSSATRCGASASISIVDYIDRRNYSNNGELHFGRRREREEKRRERYYYRAQ